MRAMLRRWFGIAGNFVCDRPLGGAGAAIILLMIIAALLANFLSPYDPLENDYGAMFQAPGARHWLGTDSFCRDVLSRILYGSRTALWVGFCSSLVGTTIGALIGASCAYFGGKIDLLMQRLMDILLSFPLIVLALVVVAVLGSGVWNVILAISIPMIPRAALVVRSSALALRQMLFIEAALILGASHWRIISRHLLPNVMAPYLIMLTARSVLIFSRFGCRRAGGCFGFDAARRSGGIRRAGALDGAFSWLGDQSRSVRFQRLR